MAFWRIAPPNRRAELRSAVVLLRHRALGVAAPLLGKRRGVEALVPEQVEPAAAQRVGAPLVAVVVLLQVGNNALFDPLFQPR
jgi:hypothetical protein